MTEEEKEKFNYLKKVFEENGKQIHLVENLNYREIWRDAISLWFKYSGEKINCNCAGKKENKSYSWILKNNF